ncbi:hypothetical protein [Umezawaea sp. Da 62-37]|uniref:hypothetical protein n=1 Tax=Umezawaea sp. Da 62-37 TaxID=3075927 RepID=UPI0028F70F69|nr:hypothetical protein [Umezawaea sp. Da 62-37]WNV83696.1 hypothetical protein RM788_36770 [Umezawaea sp. Da 62-37]
MSDTDKPSRLSWRDETPADTRALNLRESGYTGHIDLDGYPTDEAPSAEWWKQS